MKSLFHDLFVKNRDVPIILSENLDFFSDKDIKPLVNTTTGKGKLKIVNLINGKSHFMIKSHILEYSKHDSINEIMKDEYQYIFSSFSDT